MSFLAILLFCLGMGIIFWGWRQQNQLENDLMTALKGLVHLKGEINRLDDSLNALQESWAQEKVQGAYADNMTADNMITETALPEKEGIALPGKYCRVQEMAASGMTVIEIAQELNLSQDAVELILRTYPKENRHEIIP
jgi:DNA-binding NarL/FixJ family response regulator